MIDYDSETQAVNMDAFEEEDRSFIGIKDSIDERIFMNIQIFGTSKCFDSKKAMRYFKERGIKYQWIDMKEKGLSKGEYTKVKQAVGGLEVMLNPKCKDQDTLALIKYIADEDKDEKVLENQQVLKTPIVRNGAQATVGYQPDVWKGWK